MRIEELKGKVGVCIKVSKRLFKINCLYGTNFCPELLADSVILFGVTSYPNYSIMEYFAANKKISQYVPANFEVEIIEDKVLEQQWENYKRDNIDTLIAHNFPIGSDPEMFVEDNVGSLIPAFKFLGSKTEKRTMMFGPTNRQIKPIYWDGFQAEFETEANTCLGWHTDSVQLGIAGLIRHARKYNAKAKLSSKTVFDIPHEMLLNEAEEHVSLGCMPSFNVYGMKGREVDCRSLPFRSAGGHIHFGFGEQPKDKIDAGVKTLDAILGVACVSLFAKFDDPRRRHHYGMAGEYRLPPHGLEYRTLSNAWLFHPMIMNLVFDLARKALMLGMNGFGHYWKADEKEVVECINTCNVDKAREILNRNKTLFLQLYSAMYGRTIIAERGDALFNIFINGMESVIADPSSIEANWMVDEAWVTHSNAPGKNVARTLPLAKVGKKVA